jgi:hypothetical protein
VFSFEEWIAMKVQSLLVLAALAACGLPIAAAAADVHATPASTPAAAAAEARAYAELKAAEAAGAVPASQEQIARFVVSGALPAAAEGITDIKFRDFVKLPVGPRGLELNEKIRSLAGRRVRLLGYMARQTPPTPGMIVLSPVPVDLGDEDESLSDDLPVTATFVHLVGDWQSTPIRHVPGLLQFTGTLEIGPADEADGHVSSFRLRLDRGDSEILAAVSRAIITGSAH